VSTGRLPGPDSAYDLAGGDHPPPDTTRTVEEIISEAKSRRAHRRASATLVYIVVCGLIVAVLRVVFKVAHDIQHINPSAVAMVASLVVAISVLTIALAKFAFALGQRPAKEEKPSTDAVSTPSLEAIKMFGDALSKVGEIFKSMKP
jgi:hypothetical protein